MPATRVIRSFEDVARQLAKAKTEAKAATTARRKQLLEGGAPLPLAKAQASLEPGPYNVFLWGAKSSFDEDALTTTLVHLGYSRKEAGLAMERAIHIAPEPVAYLLHQSEAVAIKTRLEAAGGKVGIRQASEMS